MWNWGTFGAEMLGTAFLVAGILSIGIIIKKYKLANFGEFIFGALFAATTLVGAVAIGESKINGGGGFGFVNPGVAFMYSIAHNNFNPLLPSLVGELIGALVIALIFILLTKNSRAKDVAKADEFKYSFFKTTLGEVIGTSIFFGGIALVALGKLTGDGLLIALTVGLSLFIGIVVSSPFGSLLNIAVGFANLVVTFAQAENKANRTKIALSFANGALVNLAVGATIGGIFFLANN